MALCWWELQICWSIEAGEFHPGSALRFAHCELEWRLCMRRSETGVASEAPRRKPLRLQPGLVAAPPLSRKLLARLRSPTEPNPEVYACLARERPAAWEKRPQTLPPANLGQRPAQLPR